MGYCQTIQTTQLHKDCTKDKLYKIITGKVDPDVATFFMLMLYQSTHGHCYKLHHPDSQTDARKYFF